MGLIGKSRVANHFMKRHLPGQEVEKAVGVPRIQAVDDLISSFASKEHR